MTGIIEINHFVAVLTMQQKLMALKNMGNGHTIFTDKWFILLSLSLVAILVVLLVVLRHINDKKTQELSQQKFLELADLRCLTRDELKILVEITKRSGLKRQTSIFTVPKAFDKGCTSIMQELFSSGHDLIERKKVFAKIIAVKYKLGFAHSKKSSINTSSTKGLSSRQIPVGKKVSLRQLNSLEDEDVEATITHSDEMILVLEMSNGVNASPGDSWRIRYNMGASVWQFNAVVMNCDGNELTFNHTDNIRFINRRRFLRVRTDYPALIAKFGPMATTESDDGSHEIHPEFIDARVVQLSGPSLKIKSNVELDISERILVIFQIDDVTTIQDIGEVRGCDVIDQDVYLLVELVGLNESTITRLIKETNTMAIKNGLEDTIKDQDIAVGAI